MQQNDIWPYSTPPYIVGKTVNFDEIALLYFPLAGGQFISNVLSCCDQLFGENYFSYLNTLYTANPHDWCSAYENVHHEKIIPAHARYFNFSEWIKFEKIIYLNYSITEEETKWLLFRKKFITHPVHENKFADISIKLEKELVNHFVLQNKEYFNFPLHCVLNENKFTDKINETTDFLNFTRLNNKNLREIYKIYMKLNILRSKI
jgi:hypothetical protein